MDVRFPGKRLRVLGLLVSFLAIAGSGCRKGEPVREAKPQPPPPPPKPTSVSDAILNEFVPNEAGAVMVIMYHRIEAKRPNNEMNRTPDQFRKDLKDLYDRGFLPVTLREYAENRIDLPAGKSPVVLTFDDAYRSQFSYLDPAGSEIDPDCAVGIMEAFSREHPDFKPRGTFFVLQGGSNPPAFGQLGLVGQKFAHLVEIGSEIGCHTLSHANFRRLSAQGVAKEIAGGIKAIQAELPDAQVTSLAIPYGNIPRDPAARKACVNGTADGFTYHMSAVALAAWRPTMATIGKVGKIGPFAGQFASGDPAAIERVLPDPRQATKAGTLEYYLKYFDQNPGLRYVSDGLDTVIAVPQSMASLVDEAKVKALDRKLQLYTPAPVTPASEPRKSTTGGSG